jgi:hypothetical protein
MCDYSLHAVATRPACVGDKLVTTAFLSTSTRGFAASDDTATAVCLLPGTELCFDDPPSTSAWFMRLFTHQARRGERATFRKVNLDRPGMHHDAVEFANGRVVLVTQLGPGQHVTVLQLPVLDYVPDVEVEVGRSIAFDMMDFERMP